MDCDQILLSFLTFLRYNLLHLEYENWSRLKRDLSEVNKMNPPLISELFPLFVSGHHDAHQHPHIS
jgi:hypothetical protein